MLIATPRFILLDTATLAGLAARPSDPLPRELLSIFRSGEFLPFVTWHHLEEFFSHGDAAVCDSRVEFFSGLGAIGFFKQIVAPGVGNVGSVVDLRDQEISFVLEHPKASHQDVINALWPTVRGGFAAGAQFVVENRVFWQIYRQHFAKGGKLFKEELANMTHFPVSDMDELLPGVGQSGNPLSPEESAKRFAALAGQLEQKIIEAGDRRNVDPKVTTARLMRMAYAKGISVCSEGRDFIDTILKQDGISRERLPASPTYRDMAYEGIYVAQMGIAASQILLSRDELVRRVRKEQLPSWVIWEELDRRIKRAPKAEIGNLNDAEIASFGPYVEVLNVDKRMAELLHQAAREHPLLQMVYERVPQKRGLAGLLDHLRTL